MKQNKKELNHQNRSIIEEFKLIENKIKVETI